MTINERIKIERQIVRRVIKDAIARGYSCSVSGERGYDIDEMLVGCKKIDKVLQECTNYEECHLFLTPPDVDPIIQDGAVVSEGWVYFVFGNDGYDVISDYTSNLETLLAGAHELSVDLENKYVK